MFQTKPAIRLPETLLWKNLLSLRQRKTKRKTIKKAVLIAVPKTAALPKTRKKAVPPKAAVQKIQALKVPERAVPGKAQAKLAQTPVPEKVSQTNFQCFRRYYREKFEKILSIKAY